MELKDSLITHACRILTAFLSLSVIDALVIQPAQNLNRPDTTFLVPQPLSTGAGSLQVTAFAQTNATYNATANLSGRVKRSDCNAAMYGTPTISSCLDVYKQMMDDDKLSEFGDRTRGVFEYPLPYRLTSGQ